MDQALFLLCKAMSYCTHRFQDQRKQVTRCKSSLKLPQIQNWVRQADHPRFIPNLANPYTLAPIESSLRRNGLDPAALLA